MTRPPSAVILVLALLIAGCSAATTGRPAAVATASAALPSVGVGESSPSSRAAPSNAPTPVIATAAAASAIASASIGHGLPSPRETAMPFTLMSTDFADGRAIPRKFTCDGVDVSPALSWSGAPENAVALALIVEDPDAHDFAHWLVYNMTASASGSLPEAVSASPDAPSQGINDFGKVGYGGPCPPSGTHHYRFTLYALDAELPIATPPHAADVRAAVTEHTIATAALTATYTRG